MNALKIWVSMALLFIIFPLSFIALTLVSAVGVAELIAWLVNGNIPMSSWTFILFLPTILGVLVGFGSAIEINDHIPSPPNFFKPNPKHKF